MKRNLPRTDSACVVIGLAFLVLFSARVLAMEAGVAPVSGMQITPPESTKPQSAQAVSSRPSAGLLPIPDYSANIWTRRQLTGDWGGVRTYLANKGVQIDFTCLTSIRIRKLASGGILKTSLTVRGCTPLWFSLPARLGQRASNTTCIEVFCVNRRTRLLAPGLIEVAGINTIKSKLIDKLRSDSFSRAVIACYGQGDPPRCAIGPPQLHEMSGIDIVESLDHRPVQTLRNPSALRHTGLDRIDKAIALARVIVASVHDHYTIEGGAANKSRGNFGIFFSGIVTMTTPSLRAASATDTGFAPVSAAKSASVSALVSWLLKPCARGRLGDEQACHQFVLRQ